MNLEIQTESCHGIIWKTQSNVPENSSHVEDQKLHVKFCASLL